jgi:hypothetical protein
MSVLDDVRGLESRVADRLKELRPLVDEYLELERVAKRLGLSADSAGDAASPKDGARASTKARPKSSTNRAARRTGSERRSSTARAKTTTSRASRRAPAASPGERRQQVLGAVAERPGITVREIGTQLGVDPTSLYRSVRELERSGEIAKRGTELHPS